MALLTTSLPACTTMQAGPVNVLEEPDTGLIVAGQRSLTTREAIIQYYVNLPSDAARAEFRNRVADHYMGLIDRNYEFYSRQLFSEGIQAGLAFDTGIIGLSALGGLFEESAKDINTLISAAAGIHASIDKNLYFDRTLPALISTMDAERTKIETEIIARKNQSASDYTIEAAIRDVRRYQEAGTLMRAVTQVTETAGTELKKAEATRLQVVQYKCEPDTAKRDKLLGIQRTIGAVVQSARSGTTVAEKRAGREALSKLAEPFAIPIAPGFVAAGTDADVDAISLEMGRAMLGAAPERNFCTTAEVDALARQLDTLGFKDPGK
jgi:hypothetical protein